MIVGILGPGGCGGTFLDWSLQYLSGQQSSWFVKFDPTGSKIVSQSCVNVLDNPLLKNTAHAHLKTHPNNRSIDTVINIFKSQPSFNLHSFYYVDSIDEGRKQTTHNQIISKHSDIKFITYNFTDTDIDIIFCLQYEKIFGQKNRIENLKISNMTQSISELPIWEKRELLSLYYPDSIRGQTVAEKINPTSNLYQLDFVDMIENLDLTINKIFQYFDISVHEERWKRWQEVYTVWKLKNDLTFFKNLNAIVQCILDHNFHDLCQYNMSFAKEVVIASRLLYNHNIALKSHGINDLSQDTQQWSDIIEENVYHNLTKN
jgi:hypothetical protein